MAHPWTHRFTAVTIGRVLGVPVRRVRYWRRLGRLADYTPEAVAAFLAAETDWTGRLRR